MIDTPGSRREPQDDNRHRGRGARLLKGIGLGLLALLVLAGAVILLLYASAPRPRAVDGWSLGPPLPSPRGELASAVAHRHPCSEPPCPEAELLYVVGGLAGLGRTQDAVNLYDPARGEWLDGPPLPEPRHHLAAAGLDGAVYVSGGTRGMTRPWAPTADLWRLEAGASSWQVLPAMPEPRWGHRMVAHDRRLYVVGGEGPTSRVLIHTPGGGWTTGAEMPGPRDHLSVVVAQGRIWAIGGRAPESLARVDIYDPAADSWVPGPALPAPTSGAAEGVVDGSILVSGGEEPALGGEVFDRHWVLDPAGSPGRWRAAPPPPLAIHGADGAVFQGTLVIVGGASRHGLLSVTAWTDAFQTLQLTPARALARPLSPEE